MARKKNLKVNITGDSSGLERETRKASGSIDKFVKKTKKDLAGVTAAITGVIAAFRGFSSAISTISSFEAANSKLAAVLGTTIKNIGNLTDAAIELGRRTQYTASEVTDLQTELAKLGFKDTEILAMQESVLKFAAAVGTDLASAAARAGATMRGFDLTAEQTSDMLAVMAVSTSKSALSFEYLDETLGKVVPVTRSFGLDTRSTVTLLGTLANAGIDASSAGTALRRIFTELAKESSKLNKAIGYQPKTMGEVITALQTLRDKGIGVTEAMDMVGQYAGSTFLALVNGADDCRELYGELQDVDTALNDMYDTMTDNVEGAVKQLQSAWEGFILSLRQSAGPMKTAILLLRDMVSEANRMLFKGARDSEAKGKYSSILGGIFDREGMEGVKKFVEEETRILNAEIEKIQKKANKQAANAVFWTPSAFGYVNSEADIKQYTSLLEGLAAAYDSVQEKALRTSVDASTTGAGGTGEPGGDDDDDGKKSKKKADGLAELTAAARDYAAEAEDAAAYDAEMAAQGKKLLDQYQDLHPAIQLTTDAILKQNDLTDAAAAALLALADDAKLTTEQVIGLAEGTAALVEREQEGTLGAGKLKRSLEDLRGIFNDLTDAEADTLTGMSDADLTAEVDQIFQEYEDNLLRMQNATRDFSEAVTSLVKDAITDTFVGFGEFVGNAMTGGLDEAASNLGAGLLDTLGSLAIKVGELAIETGVALSGIKVALDSMNPYVAIAAGAALVALGTAVRNAAGNISRGASAAYSVGASGYSSYNSPEGYAERQLNIRVTGKLTAAPGVLNAVIDSENTRLEHTT